MGICCKLFLFLLTIVLAIIGYQITLLLEIPALPKLENTWWGSGDPAKEDKTIRPFKINIPDEVLADLSHRLANARRFTPPLEGVQQQYGINTNHLRNIIDFWRTKYNWREREKFLNQYPQFKVSVQGLNIHYLHVTPTTTKGLRVLPMLILHGWGGSIREFYEMIPYLTTPQKGRDFVYELIIPSLPGFGFSDPAVRPGMGSVQMAVIFKNFMKVIGFEKYYVQGGDWGAAIGHNLAVLFPENVLGLHSNMCSVFEPLAQLKILFYSLMPSWIVDKEHEHLVYPMSSVLMNQILESGYFHMQSTKPDTIGVVLNDSPVGFAAYLLEKWSTFTNPGWRVLPDAGLTKKFTLTQLLDNIMIYWVTGSITTSMRIYAESVPGQFDPAFTKNLVKVPTGCARLRHDVSYTPTKILHGKFVNLLQVNDYDGGHFAAFEMPETFAKDIYNFTEKVIRQQEKRAV